MSQQRAPRRHHAIPIPARSKKRSLRLYKPSMRCSRSEAGDGADGRSSQDGTIVSFLLLSCLCCLINAAITAASASPHYATTLCYKVVGRARSFCWLCNQPSSIMQGTGQTGEVTAEGSSPPRKGRADLANVCSMFVFPYSLARQMLTVTTTGRQVQFDSLRLILPRQGARPQAAHVQHLQHLYRVRRPFDFKHRA